MSTIGIRKSMPPFSFIFCETIVNDHNAQRRFKFNQTYVPMLNAEGKDLWIPKLSAQHI